MSGSSDSNDNLGSGGGTLSRGNHVTCGILNYFTAGISEEEALNNLLKSHSRCPDLFPRVDNREIKFWYKSFANGNFDLNQTPTTNKRSSISISGDDESGSSNTARTLAASLTINGADANDPKLLQEVCETSKKNIDADKQLYGNITICFERTFILLIVKCQNTASITRTTYERIGSICKIKAPDGKIIISQNNFVEVAADAFKNAVDKIDTKINEMGFICDQRDAKLFNDNFFPRFSKVMGSLKNKIAVSKLFIPVIRREDLVAVLNGINPGSLNTIESPFYINFDHGVNRAVRSSAHWEHLKSLKFEFSFKWPIQSLIHIPSVRVRVGTMTEESIVNYKNSLLQNGLIYTHYIGFYHRIGEIKDLAKALQPYEPFKSDDGVQGLSGRIPHPDPNIDYLSFKIAAQFMSFETKKKDV